MRRLLSPALSILLLTAFCLLSTPVGATSGPPEPPAVLTIVHLNDIYEIMPIEGGRYGGPARVATVIADLKKAGAPVLTTLGGDYLSPSALGTAKLDGKPLAGRQMVDVLGAMGLDWATFGNHEFDVSEEAFRAHLTEARFRIVSTNVTDADGKPFAGVPTSAIVPVLVGGRSLRIGLIGVTIDSTRKPWVRYRDPIQAAQEEVAKLAGQTDAIIALTHLSLAQDADFVAAVPGLDLVLGGHEHENWQLSRGPRFTPIVKADANVRSLAVTTLTFGASGARPVVATRLQLIDETIPSDQAVLARAERWMEIGFAAFRKEGFAPEAVVATSTEPLDGREATVRNRPGRLTDLIAAAMLREADDAQVAVFNSGSVRIDDVIPAGPITEYDIIRILPFGGKVVAVTMDGALLARVLDMGVNNQGLGGYLHSAGAAWTEGGWRIAGKPLDPAASYPVIMTDFLLSGGEINLGFLNKDNLQIHGVRELRDIRRVMIEELKKVYPPVEAGKQ